MCPRNKPTTILSKWEQQMNYLNFLGGFVLFWFLFAFLLVVYIFGGGLSDKEVVAYVGSHEKQEKKRG